MLASSSRSQMRRLPSSLFVSSSSSSCPVISVRPIVTNVSSTSLLAPPSNPRSSSRPPPPPLPSPLLLSSRSYLTRTAPASSATIAFGLGVAAVGLHGAKMAVVAYNDYTKSKAEAAAASSAGTGEGGAEAEAAAAAGEAEGSRQQGKGGKEAPRENFFKSWGFSGPTLHYEGGFEPKMTRREAALILGVRESATVKRIKEAHRNILILNHPDTGGSTFIASKVNEAKELLLKGKTADD